MQLYSVGYKIHAIRVLKLQFSVLFTILETILPFNHEL